MVKENYRLLIERMNNLDEEVIGTSPKTIQKILDWLDTNQCLTFKGRQLSDCHFKYHKVQGNL